MATPQPSRHRFRVEDYARMVDAGVLAPDVRVELVEGDIVEMSPHSPRHARRIRELMVQLVKAYESRFAVLAQLPLTLGEYSEPEPDFALVRPEDVDAGPRHAATAELVIEISDSTLSYDRHEKASLYARAGIPLYLLINVRQQRLELRSSPVPDTELPSGWGYAQLTLYTAGQLLDLLDVEWSTDLLLGS